MGVNVTAWLSARSRATLTCVALGMFAGVVLLRYHAPAQFNVVFYFLIPISFAMWFVSRRIGWIFVIVAVMVIFHFGMLNWNKGWNALEAWNAAADCAILAAFGLIISEIRALYQWEHELSLQDALTGLANRRAFFAILTAENRRMRRQHLPLTVAYVDVDNFKQVNDEFGHATGDKILTDLAREMQGSLRSSDTVARVGGDEFGILMPETSEAAARAVLAKLNERLQQRTNAPRALTLSIGTVTFSESVNAPEEMLEIADHALYAVKQSGKNRIESRIFTASSPGFSRPTQR